MGFVTFASFDDTLSNSHKKNIEKSFFSWEISFRTAVTFFKVRSVTLASVTNWLSYLCKWSTDIKTVKANDKQNNRKTDTDRHRKTDIQSDKKTDTEK